MDKIRQFLQGHSQPQAGDQLCQAVMQNDLAKVQQLLSRGHDPNAQNRFNKTALMYAVNLEIVDVLLQAGADVHYQDDLGIDALSCALEERNQAVIARFLQAGADLNRRSEHGWTRLRQAAFRREPDSVELLLQLGADPTLDRGKLLSAASWASGEEYNEAVERTIDLLVAVGEDVNATDLHGYSALHCAVHDYAHTSSNEEWWNASSDGADITATRALLKHSADPNAAGTNGMTPLLLAASASYGGKLCVEALLAAGAEADKTGSGGITPLMLAASHRQTESVQTLLAHGADARRGDSHGHDALFYARQSLVSLSEDADVSGIEEDAESKAWHLQYTQEQEANGQRCIALLEAALR